MAVALFYDPTFVEHDPGEGHPESPDRLKAVWTALSANPVGGTEIVAPPRPTRAELARVPRGDYADALLSMSGRRGALDAETRISEASLEAAQSTRRSPRAAATASMRRSSPRRSCPSPARTSRNWFSYRRGSTRTAPIRSAACRSPTKDSPRCAGR